MGFENRRHAQSATIQRWIFFDAAIVGEDELGRCFQPILAVHRLPERIYVLVFGAVREKEFWREGNGGEDENKCVVEGSGSS